MTVGGVITGEHVRHMVLLMRIDPMRDNRICEARQLVAQPCLDCRSLSLLQMRSLGTIQPTSAQLALRARWEAETRAAEEKGVKDESEQRARRAEMATMSGMRPNECGDEGGASSASDDELLIKRSSVVRKRSRGYSAGAGEAIKSALSSAATSLNNIGRRKSSTAGGWNDDDVATR